MSVGAADEAPRSLAEGESDAVTIAFSDPAADVCGIARIGRARSGGAIAASGLAILFAGGEPVAVRAEGGAGIDEADGAGAAGWAGAEVAGLRSDVLEPLRSWSVDFASEDGAHGFSLDLSATSAPAELEAGAPVGRLGGMAGYEQLVRVRGTVTIAGRERALTGLGQRGHTWGAPDWDAVGMARTLGVWLEGDVGLTLVAVRPAKGDSHADEAIHAVLLEPGPGDDGPAPATVPVVVADPRLSTTYDGEGRQRHAGLELYLTDDADYARRAAGEVVCGTTLDLGRLRLDCAFFRWRMEGRSGVGRYDILTRVGAE